MENLLPNPKSKSEILKWALGYKDLKYRETVFQVDRISYDMAVPWLEEVKGNFPELFSFKCPNSQGYDIMICNIMVCNLVTYFIHERNILNHLGFEV